MAGPSIRHFRGLPTELISHSQLNDMPDVGGTNSDHDARYYTQAQLNSIAAPSGASLIGVADAGGYFAGADVEAILQEIIAVVLPGDYLRLDGTNVPTANYVWVTNLTTTGTLQGGTITDGTISFTGGVGTGLVSLTDGTASWAGSNLSGFGTIQANTSVTASTLTIAGGSITDTTGTINIDNENLTTTGRIFVGDGTALLPSIAFADDTNTGIWSSANDILNISTAGVERFEIDATSCDITIPLNVAPDTGIVCQFGRVHLGIMAAAGGWEDYASFSHVDQDGTTSYALTQTELGYTLLNAASTRYISHRVGNVEQIRTYAGRSIISGNLGVGLAFAVVPANRLVVLPSAAGDGIYVRESDDGNNAIALTAGTADGILSIWEAVAGLNLITSLRGGAAFGQPTYINVNGGHLGIGVAAADANLEIQTTSAIGHQAVTIDQNDEDQAFIDFQGTFANDFTKNISEVSGSGAVIGPQRAVGAGGLGWTFACKMVLMEVNGTPRWFASYDPETLP